MENKYKSLKYACYTSSFSMSIVANLSPILFLTFRKMYGISYSALGFLVVIFFFAQLIVDLIFSFFSHKFNIEKTVKSIPGIIIAGMIIYAVAPLIFPEYAYIGILIGTIVFSASAGLIEVLISPVIAAIPSKDPDREMSKLHSVYAWGVVFVVIASTILLYLFGYENWNFIVLLFLIVPVISFILYRMSEMPYMETPDKLSGVFTYMKNKALWICVFAIFLGGAAECTMAQWCSGYIEKVFGISKIKGDIFGVAFFSVMLGFGRTLYSKIGKNIERVLLLGTIGAAVCYFIAAVSDIPFIGLAACVLTGLCTSMLWPGNLIVAAKKIPDGGVFMYAMLAAGGDFGASVGPQLIGVITDFTLKKPNLINLASSLEISAEQLGMKLGMLCGMMFPFVAVLLYLFLMRKNNKKY